MLDYKTENRLYADFISCVRNAFEVFNITGWEVRQLKQAFKFTTIKPTVFISVISINQLGRQYRKRQKTAGGVLRTNLAKKEVTIRFSATRRQLAGDTVATLNGLDVLEAIRAYLQSEPGIASLASLDYAQYRADTVRQQDFINDSDDFEFMPFFDCTCLYTDSFTEEVGKIEKVNETIYKL